MDEATKVGTFQVVFSPPQSSTERREAARLLASTAAEHGFDGIVLELWSQLGGQAKDPTIVVVREIASAVRAAGKTFVLVVPPPIYHRDQPGLEASNIFLKIFC